MTPNINEQNRYERDSRIFLRKEDHQYVIDGEDNYLSVTNFVSSFFPPFQQDRISKAVAAKRGVSQEVVLREWREKAQQGTHLHEMIEFFFLTGKRQGEGKEFDYFWNFYDHKLIPAMEPYRVEWPVFDTVSRVAGTVDFVGRLPNGRYVILDWKRVSEIPTEAETINKPWYSSGLNACQDLVDCKYNHYALQVNAYKWLLTQNYELDIAAAYLIQLHPDKPSYQVLRIEDMSDKIRAMLHFRMANQPI